MTSSFSSGLAGSAGHIRKATTPPTVGVGSYDVDKGPMAQTVSSASGTYSKEGMSMFAGTVSRRSMAEKRTEPHVAPGSYDHTRRSIEGKMKASLNPRLPGFNSSTPRSIDDYDF